jgi:hypothetical protein
MSIVGRSSQNPRFSPDSLPGLALWLDAVDANTLTLSGSNVTQWRDKSGQGNNGSNDGTVSLSTFNSRQMISFNGNSVIQGSYTNSGTTITCFGIFVPQQSSYDNTRVVSFATAPGVLDFNNIGSLGAIVLDAGRTVYTQRNSTQLITTTTFTTGALTMASLVYTGSSRQVFLNGGGQVSDSFSGSFGTTLYGIGAYAGFNPSSYAFNKYTGLVGEVIVYNSALSTAERQVVEGYLARKWGLTELTGDPYRFGGPRILPTQISGCSLWLDGADPAGTGSPPSIGTSVSTWVDKSGNGRNGISEGTSIPTFSNRGITYNGSGSYRTSYSAALPAETLFVVFRWASIGTGGPAFIGGTQWYQRLLYVDPAESRWIYFGGIASWGRWNTSPLSSNVDYMLGVTWNSSSVILHLNGSSLATAGGVGTIASFSGSPTHSLIGPGFNGTMYEMIGYNTVLTTAQRQLVEGYLATKWGLQASFPAPVAIGPYAGPIIPVRSFSPLDIDGLSLWLDAADATQFTFSSGSNISSVREKSGNTYTFTQGGTASRLTRTTVNGRPTIFLDNDGTNNAWMTSPVPLPSTLTVVQVLTPLAYSGPTAPFLWSWNTGGTGGRTAGLRCNSSNSINPYITWVGDNGNSLPITTGTSYVHFVEFTNSGANVRQSLNGTTPTAGTLTAYNVTPSVFLLGGDGPTTPTIYSRMYMSELIMFSNVLTTSQRQQLETYLADKWGLRPSMSAVAHPFRFAPAVVLPTSIPGCRMWLDAADTTTLTLSGSNVTQWRDKSEVGIHHIQTTASNQPTYGTDSVYGRPGILFNGTSSFLTQSNTSLFPISNTNTYSIFTAHRVSSNSANIHTIYRGAAPVQRQWFRWQSTFANFLADRDPEGYINFASNNVGAMNGTSSFVNDTTTSSGYINGSLIATVSKTSSAISQYLSVGGVPGELMSGSIFEVIVFNRVVTTTERQQIEGYLAHKWGLQSNLPGSTPSFATIRRALTPPFIPGQIPGCTVWLDGADTTSLTLSGSNVTQWRDKSGSSNHYTNNGTVAYQSNGLYFNGSSHIRNTTQTGFPFGATPSVSTFFVFSVQNVTSLRPLMSYGTVSCGNTGYVLYIDTDGRLYGTLYCGSANVNTGVRMNTTNIVSDVMTYTGTSGSITRAGWLNGAAMSTPSGSATGVSLTNWGITYIGAIGDGGGNIYPGWYFLGTIHEVLYFNRAVTASERRRIEGYLGWKWNLLGTLGGVEHPNRLSPAPILPTDIAGCVLWLDASDSDTFTLSGNNVTQWRDKSGLGNHGTPSGTVTRTTAVFGGRSSVSFNGSTVRGSVSVTGPELTVIAVYQPNEVRSDRDQRVVSFANPGQSDWNSVSRTTGLNIQGGGPSLLTTYRNTTMLAQSVSSHIANSPFIGCARYTGSAATVFLNTTEGTVLTGTSGNFGISTYGLANQASGSPETLNGHIAEVIVYTVAITTTQRQQLESYLAWKWGIQSVLPSASHAYRTFKP